MERAAVQPTIEGATQEWKASLPLYVASLLVTLAGIGAVGVTITEPSWTPFWVFAAVLGHGVSLGLRRFRVSMDTVFWPVILLGSAAVFQLMLVGSPLVGLSERLTSHPIDMATAMTIASLAVVRCFTLLNNGALLFSSVPAISMLALVGSTNPNAEIPLFFVLLMLGSLFASAYEAHLRRAVRPGRVTSPVLFHLLFAWSAVLVAAGAAMLFPLLVQPVLVPLSPFAPMNMNRWRGLLTFTQTGANQAPVGRGPITLSPTPVFEVYTTEGGLLRTGTFQDYTGRGWTTDRRSVVRDLAPIGEGLRDLPALPSGITSIQLFDYALPPDPDLPQDTKVRQVEQTIVVRNNWTSEIPAVGRVAELRYPRTRIRLHVSGAVSGGTQLRPGQAFQVVSRVPEIPEERLRKAPEAPAEYFPESLSLPSSTLPVQNLAREITASAQTPYDKVQAILSHIERTCRYTLMEEPTPAGQDAVAFYLFRTKRGACDLSASAAAVMCRAVGIPARVAVGYVAEEPLATGKGFLIRQEHSHMWLEAYFPGLGWAPFNPSPPLVRIQEHPLLTAWYRIRFLFGKIGGGGLDTFLLLLTVAVTLGLILYVTRRRLFGWTRGWRGSRRPAHSGLGAKTAYAYGQALRLLEQRGWSREAWMTPREYLEAVRPEWTAAPEALRSLERVTEAFQRAHFRGEGTDEDLAAVTQGLEELTRLAPRRPRPPRRLPWRRSPAPDGTA